MATQTTNSIGALDAPENGRLVRSVLVCLFALSLSLGCGYESTLNTRYGLRRGDGLSSVNGTIVLGKLFEQAGHQVSSWRRLSPKLNGERVIVWVPDRFGPPTASEVAYFENWLTQQPDRTLVYVGRDYEAQAFYWRQIEAAAVDAEQRNRARTELARVRANQQSVPRDVPASCDWFSYSPSTSSAKVQQLIGPWANGVDTAQTDIWTYRDLELGIQWLDGEWVRGSAEQDAEVTAESFTEVASDAQIANEADVSSEPASGRRPDADRYSVEPLLWADGERLLAAEIRDPKWSGSRLIVIANGSWLLNYPLVRPAHRTLAMRLVEACPPESNVCFVESDTSENSISDSDVNVPLALQVFGVFPINLLVVQLVAVGIIYCFRVFPILGRPRHLPPSEVSDFGKHITAVGEMLERGQHQGYAATKIRQYYELVAQRSQQNPP